MAVSMVVPIGLVLGAAVVAAMAVGNRSTSASGSSVGSSGGSPPPTGGWSNPTSGSGTHAPSGGGHATSGGGSSGAPPPAVDPCAGGVISDPQAAALYSKMLAHPTDTIASGEAAMLVQRLRFLGSSSCSTLANTIQSQIDEYNALITMTGDSGTPHYSTTGGATFVGQTMARRWIPAAWPTNGRPVNHRRGVYA
jgi:hypothetical protein